MIAAPIPVSAVEEARQQVERLLEVEVRWSDEIVAKTVALADLERQSGEVAVDVAMERADSSRSRALTQRIAVVRTELEDIERAIAAARRQRVAAIPAVWKARAAEVRGQLPSLREDVARRVARTAELLAALEQHEGCRYVPYVPAAVAMRSLVYSDPVTYAIPRTDAIRAEIAGLEAQAAAVESETVIRSGEVSADSVDGLISAVLADPMRIGPTVGSIRTWAGKARERELGRRSQRRGDERAAAAAMTWSMTWKDGTIDEGASGASSGEVRDA